MKCFPQLYILDTQPKREVKNIGEAGLKLTQKELVFSAAYLGFSKIYGIKDDSAVLGDNEIKNEWNMVKDSLSGKKLLSEELDGSVALEQDFVNVVSVCCEPDLFLSVLYNDENDIANYFLTRNAVMAMEPDHLEPNTFILIPLKSRELLVARIMNDLLGMSDFTSKDIKFIASEYDANEAMHSVNAENVFVKSMGFTGTGVMDFTECLSNGQKAFLYYQNVNKALSYEIRFIWDGSSLYVIRPQAGDSLKVEIVSMDRDSVYEYLTSLLVAQEELV